MNEEKTKKSKNYETLNQNTHDNDIQQNYDNNNLQDIIQVSDISQNENNPEFIDYLKARSNKYNSIILCALLLIYLVFNYVLINNSLPDKKVAVDYCENLYNNSVRLASYINYLLIIFIIKFIVLIVQLKSKASLVNFISGIISLLGITLFLYVYIVYGITMSFLVWEDSTPPYSCESLNNAIIVWSGFNTLIIFLFCCFGCYSVCVLAYNSGTIPNYMRT